MRGLLFLFLALVGFGAHADIRTVQVVPTTWRLENYVADQVVIWYSQSACASGALEFPNNASADDKNRFWSLISAAKVSQSKVFVRYDFTANQCLIISFGLTEQ